MAVPHEHDEAAEALLRAARPAPSLIFTGELERTLFPPRKRWRDRRVFAGAATATALGSAFFGFTLAGGGPLASTGGDAAVADPECTTVYVTKVQPTGQLVRRADGTVTVETTRKPVTTAQQRCK